MENANFHLKYFKDFNIPDLDNIDTKTNSLIFNNSIYNDLIILLLNGSIIYKGKYSIQSNSFSFSKYNFPSNNDENQFLQIDFTSNYIYFISQNKNEIFYTSYNSSNNSLNNNIFNYCLLKGIVQKKKIKMISCGKNSTLFLTYGGMVYNNNDNLKDNQKLITDLLEYNIENISSGSGHFLCNGYKRNSTGDISDNVIFSWGDNTFCQCGFDTKGLIIQNPKILIKNINVEKIVCGNNHSAILTKDFEVILFGDNQYKQCKLDNRNMIKLCDDIYSPIQDISYLKTYFDYFIKNNEVITHIELKGDSSLIITDKQTLLFRGKFFNSKEKIFKLKKNSFDMNQNKLLTCFNGLNYFLLINKINNPFFYEEIKSNNINYQTTSNSTRNNRNISPINCYHISNDNKDYNTINYNKKLYNNKSVERFNTLNVGKKLTFEELKKEQNNSLVTSTDLSENSLNELKSYISLLGISFCSSYKDSHLSFRPTNLPPKTKEEENFHRKLVFENRQLYMDLLKEKQNNEKKYLEFLELKRQKQEKKAEYWLREIIPNWTFIKKNKNIKKYFYEGIPNSIRGKVWILCIGNKFSITRDYYEIEAKKSIQLLIKTNKKNKPKNNDEIIENDDSSLLSLETKKVYAQYIKKTFDKEKSINLIDLDIERTFPYLGVFKKDSQLGENLREILRIFVVSRPDIGYVQGLSYIAGTLLLQMDKFQTFICFMNIILSPNIFAFYRLDEESIRHRLELFNDIFECNLPILYKYFKKVEILPEHYLLEWFMTLFTRSIHIDMAFRIWDIYMIEGIIVLYKSAVVILSIHEKELLNLDFAGIMNKLKNLDANHYDEDKFIEKMSNVKFTDKIINKINKLNEDYLPRES